MLSHIVEEQVVEQEVTPRVVTDVLVAVANLHQRVQHSLGERRNQQTKPHNVTELLVALDAVLVQRPQIADVFDDVHVALAPAERVVHAAVHVVNRGILVPHTRAARESVVGCHT